MNSRKKVFIVSAVILAVAAIAFTVVSFATPSSPNFDKPTLKLSVPSDPIAGGGTFTVAVSVANASVLTDKIAGIQVKLDFDTSKLTASSASPSLDTEVSTAYINVNENNVRFVCVKNEFSSAAGYSDLSDLFTVTFTAKTALEDPTTLFSKEDLTLLVGNVEALKVDSDSFYGGNAEEIALLLFDSELEVTLKNEDAGSVIIVPTPAGETAMNTTALSAEFSDTVTVTTTTGTVAVGTGSIVSYNGKTVTVVIAGDVDGDGIVTVYDANIICKQGSDASNPTLSDAPAAASKLAGKDAIINHVIGESKIS